VGAYIEVGQFRSVRSRIGIKWSKKLLHKRKRTKIDSEMQSAHIQIATSQQTSKQVFEDIITKAKIFIENSINRANKDIPVECSHERNK
jgi:hypothetical protein